MKPTETPNNSPSSSRNCRLVHESLRDEAVSSEAGISFLELVWDAHRNDKFEKDRRGKYDITNYNGA